MKHATHVKADLLMIIVTLIAAAGWIFSLKTMEVMPPLLFLGVRFLIAGLFVGLFGLADFRQLNARQIKKSLLTGAVMTVAMMCWMVGLHHATHVGVGAFISSLGMILAPIMGLLMFRIHLPLQNWLATGVATIGLACLSLEHGLQLTMADSLFLASAFGFAIQFNLNSRFSTGIPIACLTAIQLSLTGAVSLLVGLTQESWPPQFGTTTLGWLLASIFIATSLRFFLQIKAQSLTPVKHAALIMTLEPVWTSLLAAWWLNDAMSRIQLAGCILIFIALVSGRISFRRGPKSS
ncbi:DMT family transporter [Leeia oryzae]|uniref:DMT family transporter n=1 Tax=Leeia oryzae TaxID=356662 RepID=UPI0003671179|nr:DMT family transporter [Leeia oryzae]